MWSLVAGTLLGTPILFYLLFAFVGCYKWRRDFAHRKARTDLDCPSSVNYLAPALRGNMRMSTRSNKYLLVHNWERRQKDAAHKGASAFKVSLFRKKDELRKQSLERDREMAEGHLAARDKSTARKLDMDHVYLSLGDFLWGYVMIAPSTTILFMSAVAKMIFRRWLKAKGFIKVRPEILEATIAKLILETTLATYFLESEEDQNGNKIGRFVWVDVPVIIAGDKVRVFERLTIFIDLTNHRWRSTQLLGYGPVGASDTLCLMGFILVGPVHVKVHSYANWAVDLESKNAFVRRMSVATVVYNYFGFSSSTGTLSWIHKAGLTSSPFASMQMCFVKGIESGMHEHTAIRSLAPYSNFIYFTLLIRRKFLQCFTKYTEDFPSTSGEALFIGTVLHGLDHTMMAKAIEDPLWFEAEDPFFQSCAEMSQIVRAGFVDDLPFIAFKHKYKNAGHPFYREVYNYAATVNQQMADSMDCCIIK